MKSILKVGLLIAASMMLMNCAAKADESQNKKTLTKSAQSSKKPNILVWVADDQFRASVGVYGGDPKQTPNIDEFAKQGMLFTKAYSTTSICTPARSALYTGMYPIHNGSHPNHSGLKKDVASMPTIMSGLGYRSALVGKDGVHEKPTRPNNTFVWDAKFPTKGKPIEGTERGGKVAKKHRGIDYKGIEKFFNETSDKPFAMFVASTLPHGPDLGKIANGMEGYPANNWKTDEQFGRFLNMLEQAGKADNTVVIYVSDHGSNTPYSKFTLYQPAVHVPMIVRWPGQVQANSVSHQLVDFTDIMPTLMEIAGGQALPEMDGFSLTNILQGNETPLREDIFLSFTMLGVKDVYTPYPLRSVVTQQYKLIHNLNVKAGNQKGSNKQKTTTDFELYDLHNDYAEENNLAGKAEYKAVQADLLKRLKIWQQRVGDKGMETELEAVEMFPDMLSGKVKLN